jgi:hypothetical protein
MTTARRAAVSAAVLVVAVSACRRGLPPPCCINLLDAVASAEIRPIVRPPDAIQVIDAAVGGTERRSLSVIVPSRVSLRLRVPTHAVFHTALAVDAPAGHQAGAGIAFSAGISDGRTYEPLMERTILAGDAASWQPVQVDLRRYAGWQWSLFYRPSSIAWEIVLNSYGTGPGAERLRALWAEPAITGDRP